jgi:subtilisin family serine protease
MLSSTYSDVLLVVSGGNTGAGGHASSIQNPADCKNSFSVGASLSYGNDIRSKEKGIEYLAHYSSRGPTFDGRMKPDIVAPGHFILAPNADPSIFGECDGSSQPDVQYSLSAGKGARYVSGTSMSTPVVAGSASIVRQYFEEGWCTEDWCCGSKGCGTSIDPSGSLLKAILLNGAQPLRGGVQQVPDGIVFEDDPISEYDSIQGMGRMNLLNSLPLTGENNIKMMVINDKGIIDGAKDEYNIQVDLSNGCKSDLRVTLVWYDPPGAVGCTNCVMNDLDLYMENIDGSETFYPNGLSHRDKKNTVERIRVSPLQASLCYFHDVCS